jgi:hypothetical protein
MRQMRNPAPGRIVWFCLASFRDLPYT